MFLPFEYLSGHGLACYIWCGIFQYISYVIKISFYILYHSHFTDYHNIKTSNLFMGFLNKLPIN